MSMEAPFPMPWPRAVTMSIDALWRAAAAAGAGAVAARRPPRARPARSASRGLPRLLAGIGLLTLLAAAPLQAADIAERFQSSCFSCHGEEMYTRSERRVSSRAALEKRVRGCTKAVGGSWSDADISALVELLNTRYYRLP
jgi:mono/diheme cytochrome c family protein